MLIFNGVFNQIYFTLFSKILVKYFAYIADFYIPRYRHQEIAIRYAVMLYVYAGISSHQVPKAMQLAGLLWNGITDDIPSHVTVLDWVEKCGLSLTRGCMREKAAEEAYSLIFDNSITVCGQDLHLQLRSSSEHPGHSLRQTDVSVVRMKAGKGWDTEMISYWKTMNRTTFAQI